MERTNFVRGSIGIERCRAVCRLLIQWGAELLGLPQDDEEPRSVCWWDDPLDISRAGCSTYDGSQTHLEHRWSDADEMARTTPAVHERRVPYNHELSVLEPGSWEKGDISSMKETKLSDSVTVRTARFSIAQFMKLNGAVWGGKADARRLDLPPAKPTLHVPLIRTRAEVPTFIEYK